MNNTRRKELDRIGERVQSLQDYLDNMPESMQDGEKAQKAQDAIDALENAVSTIEGAETCLNDVGNSFEEARG